MRAFLAIQLSEEMVNNITEFMNALPQAQKIKLVPPQNLHLTVKFLDEIDATQEADILQKLRPIVEAQQPFTMTVTGVDAFPNRKAPRILCLKVDPTASLMNLAEDIRDKITCGDNKPFQPHLTVARIKEGDPSQAEYFEQFFANGEEHCFGDQLVDSVDLMYSDLSGGKPRYTVREQISFL